MNVDSSALLAVALEEEGFEQYLQALVNAPARFISAATLLEAGIALEAKRPGQGAAQMFALVRAFEIEVVPFTEAEAVIGIQAYRKFGKGRHPAALNLGDCASYAAARLHGRPLLFKGEDFARTDVRPALTDE